ncbi:MAG: FMN-binding protein, partial [Spirochaetota bacterium]|nr:FMN-binding protein [Spirochaetota bacterium]
MSKSSGILQNDVIKTGLLLAGFAVIIGLILGIVYEITAGPIEKAEAELEKKALKIVFPKKYLVSKGKALDLFYLSIKGYIENNTSESDKPKIISQFDNDFKTFREKDFIEFIVQNEANNYRIDPNFTPIVLTQKMFNLVSTNFKKNNLALNKINYYFSSQPIYIIEKGKGFSIFKNKIKPPNFDLISKKDFIEFLVTKKSEKSHMKLTSLTDKQSESLLKVLGKKNIKLISYYHVYSHVNDSSKANIEGWVIKFSASGGYSGNIEMLIGINKDKRITGYTMLSHNETPGLGVKANYDDFIQAFIGKDPLKMPSEKKEYKSLIGIDSISGATITSIAITKGIKIAYEKLYLRIKEPDAL